MGLIFANYDIWLAIFAAITIITLILLPDISRMVFAQWGGRVSEPEIKFIFLVLLALGGLAVSARSEAVLPAYLIGIVVAGLFAQNKVIMLRMRSTVFVLLTPFFFIKAGTLVSASALIVGMGALFAQFGMKMVTKVFAVWPTCRIFRMPTRISNYTTCMMSTGLTFGSISALYGLNYGYITRAQYSILVAAVIGSAVIPTIIGQVFFQPREADLKRDSEYSYSGTAENFLHTPEE